MKVTSHFLETEIGAPPSLLRNSTVSACAGEECRAVVQRRIRVIRGYSTPEHNEEVGGVPDSYHLIALALDFIVEGLDNHAAFVMLQAAADRLPMVRKIILDESKLHLHMEARHPDLDDGSPILFLIEKNHVFASP